MTAKYSGYMVFNSCDCKPGTELYEINADMCIYTYQSLILSTMHKQVSDDQAYIPGLQYLLFSYLLFVPCYIVHVFAHKCIHVVSTCVYNYTIILVTIMISLSFTWICLGRVPRDIKMMNVCVTRHLYMKKDAQ